MSSPLNNFIAGTEVASRSNQIFSHASPRDESDIIDVPKSDLMDVVNAVQAMNSSQAVWLKETHEERALRVQKLLTAFKSRIENSNEELSACLARDIGMPIQHALERSIPAAIAVIQETQAMLETAMFYPPTGNAVVFLGWTDPLLGFCRRIPQILASGNAVCVKPSSHAPRTAFARRRFFS